MSEHVLIIAEAGVNHNGSLQTAFRLAEEAASAGADVIKFQMFFAEKLVRVDARKVRYQDTFDPSSQTQYEMLKRLELAEEEILELIEHCRQIGIEFLCTAFDLGSLDFLCQSGMKRIKVPSGEITNKLLLRAVASKGLPVVLSTGGSDFDEVVQAVGVLIQEGLPPDELALLQCTSAYPTPSSEVNLRVVEVFSQYFQAKVGLSDHTLGDEVAIAAVALGAKIIEKHFTLDQSQAGPDHFLSVDPEGLRSLVAKVRSVEAALGDGVKRCMPSENEVRLAARRSLVASRVIRVGELFSEENVDSKRPATGLSPMDLDLIFGKPAPREFHKDEDLKL